MNARTLAVLALVTATGCSQRAPWRVVPAPTSASPSVTATNGDAARRPSLSMAAAAPTDATAVRHVQSLYFPVAIGDSTRLDDSFEAPRDGGARKHQAIDIMAPHGTPVLSAGDGRILRLSRSAKGGITLYAADLEERFVYYYAHLDRYHPGLYAGKPLMRGDTLGYVGTTGNSPKDVPHLHFQIMHMPADRKFWMGEPVNPYPLLKQAGSAHSGK